MKQPFYFILLFETNEIFFMQIILLQTKNIKHNINLIYDIEVYNPLTPKTLRGAFCLFSDCW